MISRRSTWMNLLLFLLLPAASLAQDATGSSPQAPIDSIVIGARAPTFSLKDAGGADVSLSDSFGKAAVVLSFWSIYCDSCVEEMLALQKLENKYRGKDLVIMAVNEDIQVPHERIRRFLDRLQKFRGKISYPLLYDDNAKLFNAFGATTLPTLILIDRDGKVARFYRGFDAEGERDIFSDIERLAAGTPGAAGLELRPVERSEVITVVGESPLCGFFDAGGWRKSFTGNESLEQEVELSGDIARRESIRLAVTEAVRMLGLNLYSTPPTKGCVENDGIHLGRDPFDTGDSISSLLAVLEHEKFFETVSEQEMTIDSVRYVSREVRVAVERLSAELKFLGYNFEPLRITFTYVNMSPLDQKQFLLSVLRQSRFIGLFETPVFTPHSTSQVFEVYTSSQGFADEILGMDFGNLQVFVEEVTPTSLELEVWK